MLKIYFDIMQEGHLVYNDFFPYYKLFHNISNEKTIFPTKISQVIFISRGTYSELFPFCFSPQHDLLYWLHFFHSQPCYTESLCPMSQSQIIYLGYLGVKILSNKIQLFCHISPPSPKNCPCLSLGPCFHEPLGSSVNF